MICVSNESKRGPRREASVGTNPCQGGRGGCADSESLARWICADRDPDPPRTPRTAQSCGALGAPRSRRLNRGPPGGAPRATSRRCPRDSAAPSDPSASTCAAPVPPTPTLRASSGSAGDGRALRGHSDRRVAGGAGSVNADPRADLAPRAAVRINRLQTHALDLPTVLRQEPPCHDAGTLVREVQRVPSTLNRAQIRKGGAGECLTKA